MSTDDLDAQDQADMARLAAGQDAALNALMARHSGPLFGFLCRFLGDEDAANDLAQETFVRVYQHRQDFQAGRKFSTWLFTIAGNLARNHLRARARRPEEPLEVEGAASEGRTSSLPAEGGSPADQTVRTEQQAAVRTAVAELPEDLREAIVLCELEDCSVAEAATILHTTAKAVESRLYRARGQLRQHLTRWLKGSS